MAQALNDVHQKISSVLDWLCSVKQAMFPERTTFSNRIVCFFCVKNINYMVCALSSYQHISA